MTSVIGHVFSVDFHSKFNNWVSMCQLCIVTPCLKWLPAPFVCLRCDSGWLCVDSGNFCRNQCHPCL